MNANPLANAVLRVGVWFLVVVELAVGVIATLAPHIFYDRVPWVSLAPPYSEHLMRDYGAMNLALALVAVVAAITMDRLMVRTLLSAYVVFAIPHLIFHVTHHQHYTTAQAAGETAALVVSVLLPVGMLVLTAGMTSSTSRTPQLSAPKIQGRPSPLQDRFSDAPATTENLQKGAWFKIWTRWRQMYCETASSRETGQHYR